MILSEKIVDSGFGLIDNNKKKKGHLVPFFRSVLVCTDSTTKFNLTWKSYLLEI
jgi:hypothetical protein